LNICVFKWRLKWECFHTVECQQLEFQVDGAATEEARRVSSVSMQGTTSSGASKEHRARVVHGSLPAS